MPPRKLKPKESTAVALPDLASKFPFQVGNVVEMKSHESGYRGAWFRVQVKKISLDRKGNIWSTMVYKDYTDENEEEIRVYEKDPTSDQQVLMVRPLPPSSVKESNFNKTVHTKMCVVYRDEWEVGDVVDWWYHHCWWSAKVISVVGDGRFQIVCPAPPGGEGGVYLANSRDMRPSLKWSIAAQWTAPPSKEIGKIPCARIVWLLDNNEVGGFSTLGQGQLPQRRGRPKLVRGVNNSIVRKEPTVAMLGKGIGRTRRSKVTQLNHSSFHGQSIVEAPNKDTKVPRKRGRPRKVDGHEEVAKKRVRPIVIKVIHPRQDPGDENVEHEVKSPLVDEARPKVDEEGNCDIHPTETNPEVEMRGEAQQENGKLEQGDEDRKWAKNESPEMEKQLGKENTPQVKHETSLVAKEIHHEERRQGIRQKRSVIRLLENYMSSEKTQLSNGSFDQAKRQKLECIRRVSRPGLGNKDMMKCKVQEEDVKKSQKGMTNVNSGEETGGQITKHELLFVQSKSGQQQMKLEEDNLVGNSTGISHTGDVVIENMLGLVTQGQSTIPCLSEGKESCAHPISRPQQSKEEKENGDQQVEVFASTEPVNREVDGETYQEALDLKVLEVLNAYEEAFSQTTLCLEAENTNTCLNQDPSAKKYMKDSFMNECCPLGQQKSLVAMKDLYVATTNQGAIIKGTSPRKKSSLHDLSLTNSELAQPQERLISCNQKKPPVSSTCKDLSSPNTKYNTLEDKYHMESTANVSATLLDEVLTGSEALSRDVMSMGKSPNLFSGRVATISRKEDRKDTLSRQDGAPIVDQENSRSSLEISQANGSRSATACLSTSQHLAMKVEKSDKNEFPSLQKRNIMKPLLTRKVSLSRKLIYQARREFSAKRRRRSYRDSF